MSKTRFTISFSEDISLLGLPCTNTKFPTSHLMLAAFLCVINDDYFVIILSCSLSTTFAKCTKTWQELHKKHPQVKTYNQTFPFALYIQVVAKTLNVVVVFPVGSMLGTRRKWKVYLLRDVLPRSIILFCCVVAATLVVSNATLSLRTVVDIAKMYLIGCRC